MSWRSDVKLPLSPMMIKFVLAYLGDATAAAREAGSKRPEQTGYELMQLAQVQKAIAEKQAAMCKESGKRLAKATPITPMEVMEIAASLARSAESESARVAATTLCGKLLGMIITKHEDVSKLAKGKTAAEMDFFAIHGYWPDSDNVQPNEPSTSEPESRDARVGQPN